MHRYIFWGAMILGLVIIGLIVDQIFYRIIRLFIEKQTANTIRLVVFCIVIITIVANIVIGHFITRLRININNVAIESNRLPKAFDGFKIAHISDFHIDSFDPDKEIAFVEEIADKILAEQPDIICFTGDLVTIRSAQAIPFRKILGKLSSTGIPVYSIMGNHDYADYVWNFDESRRLIDRDSLRTIQKEAGWTVLDNDHRWITRGNDSIRISGVENIGEPPFTTYGNLKEAIKNDNEANSDPFTILLSHNPTHWRSEVIPSTNIDLTLSGHTHAMQLKVFGWSPGQIFFNRSDGAYKEGKQQLYVNIGLGELIPFRVGAEPEITIITLKKSL
mgnify:CR=1 FL=1